MAKKRNEDQLEDNATLSLEDRAVQFFIDYEHLGFDHVFVTSDGAVFYGNALGDNLAMSHAATLEDKTILTVRK